MRGYPLVNLRGAGRPFAGTPVPLWTARAVPFLGRSADGAAEAARADLEAAQEYLNRAERTYPDLAGLVGESKAVRAVGQARASVERARKAYESALELADTGGGP